jgi:hypothetical protein
MRGTILDIRPQIKADKLKVMARIRTKDWGDVDACLPDRETAAFLPRSVLVGEGKTAPRTLLKTMLPILKRMSTGRLVRLWRYNDQYYFSFLSWRDVTFVDVNPSPAGQTAILN